MNDVLVSMRWIEGHHQGKKPFLAIWNGNIVWAQYCSKQRKYWASLGDFITLRIPRDEEKLFTHWMPLPAFPHQEQKDV